MPTVHGQVNNRTSPICTSKGLCFGCLNFGHHSKKCERRSVCDTCKGKHPTCLHQERDKEVRKNKEGDKEQKESKGIKDMKEIKQSKETPNETISQCIVQTHSSNLTSTISPVWLSTTNDPDHEILLYALLDSQSDTTFILQEKADALYCDKRHVQLRLSTLSSRDTVIPSERLYRAANQRLLFFKENSSSCNLHKRVYSC